MRKVSPGQQRFAEYQIMLEEASRHALPWICENPADIEKLLALQGASLIEARFGRPVNSRDGSKRISRAIVTGLTMDGRKAVQKGQQSPLASTALSGRHSPRSGSL